MEPRPIEPQDIRVGMRVRCEWAEKSDRRVFEFTVTGRDDRCIRGYSVNISVNISDLDRTWTLLADAPTPDRPVGSHWRGTVQTGTVEYVLNQHGDYLPVRMPEGWSVAALRRGYDDNEIACLNPLPALDPAVLWPRAVVATVCRASTVDHESSRYYQCDRVQDHDGPHVEHVDAEARYVWGDPR